MSLMKGKKGLIMGVANERSIAWGISQKLAEAGAELAFTYLGDALKKRVIPLAEKLNSKVTFSCDVENKEEVIKLFEDIKSEWGQIDFVVHAVAFSDKSELSGEYLNTTRENFLRSMLISCFSFTEVAKEASKIMDHIDDLGGASASIETGYMQTEIQEASVSWQHEVESNERTIVGVNAFIDPSEDATPIFRPNHEVADAQLNRLAELRKNRNSEQVQSALDRLRTDANGQENLMPTIIQAVRSYATLGEICGVLRDEWGEYTPITVV